MNSPEPIVLHVRVPSIVSILQHPSLAQLFCWNEIRAKLQFKFKNPIHTYSCIIYRRIIVNCSNILKLQYVFIPIILFLGYNFILYQKKITLSCYSLMLSKRGFGIGIIIESGSFFIFVYSFTYNRILFYNKFEFCSLSFLIYRCFLKNKQAEFWHRSLKHLAFFDSAVLFYMLFKFILQLY